jgi:hypothetical protein
VTVDTSNAAISRLMKAIDSVEQLVNSGKVTVTEVSDAAADVNSELTGQMAKLVAENKHVLETNAQAKQQLDNLITRMENA